MGAVKKKILTKKNALLLQYESSQSFFIIVLICKMDWILSESKRNTWQPPTFWRKKKYQVF